MSAPSEYFPPTLGLRVRNDDGTVSNLILDHDKPIASVEAVTIVPHFKEPTWTSGGITHYRKKTVSVLDKELVFRDHEANPPMKRRRAEKYENNTPKPGDMVGFVNGTPLKYGGGVNPSEYVPEMGACVFTWESKQYVTMSTAVALVMGGGPGGCKMTSMTKRSIEKLFGNCKGSFVVKHSKDAPYDTMVLVKLLKAASKKCPRITFVPVSIVNGVLDGYELKWVQNDQKNNRISE